MMAFNSTVWDRLTEPVPGTAVQQQTSSWSLAQYKRVIARDLEVLLNTRVGLSADELADFPACSNSIINFGLADVAQLCLTSSEDRNTVCGLITAAIARHEPRLTQVRARLIEQRGMINRLSFAISANLRALGNDERVQLDVTLAPSNLHYSIR